MADQDANQHGQDHHQHKHKLSPIGKAALVSGLLLILFVLVHTIVGAVYYAWPFDAKFIWVAWLGAILLPLHIIFVGIQRYRARQRRKEWEKLPPEQRPKRPHQHEMTEEEKAKMEQRMKTMRRGFIIRWVSGVLVVLLVIWHIIFNSVLAGALVLLAFGWHVFYATGCVLRDLNANRDNRKYWRILTVVVVVIVLAFYLWAHLAA